MSTFAERCERWLRWIGTIVVLRYTLNLVRTLHRHFLAPKTNLKETYGSPDCWAVVTGASSGVGQSYARELAKQGFNVLAIARREENLRTLCEELITKYGIKADLLTFDFSDALAEAEYLQERVMAVTNGNVAILVHMAGNSDLARHFTDKSMRRNVEIMRLQVEGTLVVLQTFARMMCLHRRQRSAIITAGAIAAYYPLPGFATSSANKAHIRFVSEMVGYEFKEYLDVMCAHPIAVESEILKNRKWVNIPADVFARNSLGDLGRVSETNGCFRHDIFVFVLGALPAFLRNAIFWHNIPVFSQLLDRPIDERPLLQKIQG